MKTLRAYAAALLLGAAFAGPALADGRGGGAGHQARVPQPGLSAIVRHGGRPVTRAPGLSANRNFRRGRHHRRDRDGDGFDYGYGYGIGYGGSIDGDRGYFAEDAGAPEVANGHARYDYDRGYPYEYFAEREREPAYAGRRSDVAPRVRGCETEWTQDRRSGRQVSVRVCRN